MDNELKKAKILVYGKDICNDDAARTIDCLFNPAEYTIRTAAAYNNKSQSGRDEMPPQFLHGENSTMSLSLYFDSTGNLSHMNNLLDKETTQPPVTIYTEQIARLLKIDGDLHTPPVIAFVWGNLKFKGVLKSVNQAFTYFGVDGRPLRAKLDLTISSVPGPGSERATPFFSPDRTKKRPLLQGMSLWQMAYEEYGDTEKWRMIAKANGLMNPLDVTPGQILRLPPLITED